MKKILFLAEHQSGSLKKISIELAASANILYPDEKKEIFGLLIGVNLKTPANTLAKEGVTVLTLETKNKSILSTRDILLNVLSVCNEIKPDCILGGNTSTGSAVLPGLAAKMPGSAILTNIKKIFFKNNCMKVVKPVLNGRYDAEYSFRQDNNRKLIFAIQQGVFQPAGSNNQQGEIKSVKPVQSDGKIIVKKTKPRDNDEKSAFDNAKVIVSAGRGIGEEENIKKLKKFSKLFQSPSIAGSRPIIDNGWLPYKFQVGITGKIVSPEAYIAMGISGSSQHIAGMRNSGIIISVNTDSNAAIFNFSDICIVADLFEFMEEFTNYCDELN